MNLVNRIILAVFLLSVGRCHADNPIILLDTEDGSWTINEGEDLSISCIWHEETEWKFPGRYNSCYSPLRQNGTKNILERKTEAKTLFAENGTYLNALTIVNVSYLDAGFVECASKSSSSIVARFFLFVKSEYYFLMPCVWTETNCILPEDTQDNVDLSPYLDITPGLVIPCKPSSESYNMTVTQGDNFSYMDVHFNPFQGFQLMDASTILNQGNVAVTCLAINGETKDWCYYKLRYSAGKPEIQLPSKKLTVKEGDSFSVACYGDAGEVRWNIPPRDKPCHKEEKITDIKERMIERNGKLRSSTRPFFSILTLTNISGLDAGYIDCQYAFSSDYGSDHFYLFVNSTEYLLLPCKVHEQGDCDSQIPSYFLYSLAKPYVPCRPTSESVIMEVRKGDQKLNVTWDPFEGFKMPEDYFRYRPEDTFVCSATSKENNITRECRWTVGYVEIRQKCEVNLNTTIRSDNIVANYSNVTLQCIASCAIDPSGLLEFNILHENSPLRRSKLNAEECIDEFVSNSTNKCVKAEFDLGTVTINDGGLYSCQIKYPMESSNLERNLTSTFYLDVQAPKPPVFLNPNAEVKFNVTGEMHQVSLDCQASGNPPPTCIWKINNVLLDRGDCHRKLLASASEITCVATNDFGATSRNFSLIGHTTTTTTTSHENNTRLLVIGGTTAGVTSLCIAGLVILVALWIRGNTIRAKLTTMASQYFWSLQDILEPVVVSQSILGSEIRVKESVGQPLQNNSQEQSYFHRTWQSFRSFILGFSMTSTKALPRPSTPAIRETPIGTNSVQLTEIPYDSNKYELDPDDIEWGELIGGGHYGLVFKGRIKRSSTISTIPVAIKCPKISKIYVASFTKEDLIFQFDCLAREIKMLSVLGRNVNVVGLEGAVTRRLKDGVLYMALELCDGGSLEKFLQRHEKRFTASFDFDYFNPEKRSSLGPKSPCSEVSADIAIPPYYMIFDDRDRQNMLFQPLLQTNHVNNQKCKLSDEEFTEFNREFLTARDLVIFAYQIARGMNFLHESNCLHRDLAARNVLVCEGNVLKITDFGLCKDLEKYGRRYKVKTPGNLPYKWLAPECLTDSPVFFPASDVWSYGVLLWELFALGKEPYEHILNDNLSDYLKKGNRLELPDFVPSEMKILITTCWFFLHKDRPSFALLKGELVNILNSLFKKNNNNNVNKLPEDIIRYYEDIDAIESSAQSTPTNKTNSILSSRSLVEDVSSL